MPNARHIREGKAEMGEEKFSYSPIWQSSYLLKILKDRNPEIEDAIRGGTECVVAPLEGNEKLVAAYRYVDEMSGIKAREMFYIHRVFSILFPHNFPRFHASLGANPADTSGTNVTGTIRERIHPVRYPRAAKEDRGLKNLPARILGSLTNRVELKYPFSTVTKAAREMHLGEFRPDPAPSNFMLGSDGGEYYVDQVGDFTTIYRAKDAILKYMAQNEYSETDRKAVTTALDRLEAIAKEKETETATE